MKLTHQDHDDIIWALAYIAQKVVAPQQSKRFMDLREKLVAEQHRVNERERELVQ